MDTYKNSCCYFGVVAEDNQYQVSYELTNMCNLKCNHCFNESDRDSHCGLPLEKVKRLIDELVSKNVKSFYITGGEPTIYQYFEEVLKHINLKGAEAILATNGLEIESIIPVIKRYVSPVGVFISLDGLYNIHDEFRNKQGAFEKVVENIKRLISQQIPVRISTVIWEKNIAQLEQMVEFVKKLGVYQIHFTVLVSVGRAKQNSMEVDENRYKEITGIVKELDQQYSYDVFKVTMRRNEMLSENCENCMAGKKIIHIDVNGNIHPCSWIAKSPLKSKYSRQWQPGLLDDCLKSNAAIQNLVQERINKHGYSGCPAIAAIYKDEMAIDPLNTFLS